MENAQECNNLIDELFLNKDPFVKFWACSLARNHKYRIGDVIKILTEISNDKSLKIVSHNAEMTLKHKFKEGDFILCLKWQEGQIK